MKRIIVIKVEKPVVWLDKPIKNRYYAPSYIAAQRRWLDRQAAVIVQRSSPAA